MTQLILYLTTHQLITCLIVLPFLVLVNIALGLALANFTGTFDKTKFLLGFKKGLAVYIAIAILSATAQVLVIADLDLIPTVSLIVYTVVVTYLIQIIEKIKTILGYKQDSSAQGSNAVGANTNVIDVTATAETEVPIETDTNINK